MDTNEVKRKSKHKPAYNPEFHPEDLIKRMVAGETNIEIIAEWSITEKCFYNWLNDHSELKEAYEIGKPKWERAWIKKGVGYMEEGNREAFKYWNRILTVKGSKEWKEEKSSTNVNINQLNQINNYENKTEVELMEILQNKLEKLKLPTSNLIEATYKVIDDTSTDNE